MPKKAILLILDGWGHGEKNDTNAIHLANTPFIDSLYSNWPNSELITFGSKVGLPDGQMGNSEVGHLNIGAGRIVYQDFAKINKAIADKKLEHNRSLLEAFTYAKENNKSVHFIGLVGDGGIHSHQNHLVRLCEIATKNNVNNVYVHAFTDGRDTSPTDGINFLTNLEKSLQTTTAIIASVIGRYYAMDRDHRWERIKKAYDLLTEGIGEPTKNILESIQHQYQKSITDEFIEPISKVDINNNPIGIIKEGDVVISFNFRTDRCRQITEALTQKNFPEFAMEKKNLYYVTMTNYDHSYKNIHVLFDKDNLRNTLGEVISNAGLKQIRIAETEKYPHVTFFFSGGRETPFEGDIRIMANSPKVATYDLQPKMSAKEITTKVIAEINNQTADFICLNFANPDMVGHTGDQPAIIEAVETVDSCTQKIVNAATKQNYQLVIIADHGNAEKNKNEDGSPHTAHTTNMVPCFIINTNYNKVKNGCLADIAPTILQLMEIEQPAEMTGTSLLENI